MHPAVRRYSSEHNVEAALREKHRRTLDALLSWRGPSALFVQAPQRAAQHHGVATYVVTHLYWHIRGVVALDSQDWHQHPKLMALIRDEDPLVQQAVVTAMTLSRVLEASECLEEAGETLDAALWLVAARSAIVQQIEASQAVWLLGRASDMLVAAQTTHNCYSALHLGLLKCLASLVAQENITLPAKYAERCETLSQTLRVPQILPTH